MQPNPLFAGLGPFAGLAQAGSQLATRGIQGLFGIKDPEIEAQRAIAMAAQNPNDPATLQAAAQALAQAGKIDQAMALAGQARQIQQQERTFGLEQRRVALSEKQAEDQALNQAERLSLSKEELQVRKQELKAREDLNAAQVDRIYAEIERLDKGDYYITEQKGGITGTETIGFIAVNKRDPKDQVTIPLVSAKPAGTAASVVPPAATWQYIPGKGMQKIEAK